MSFLQRQRLAQSRAALRSSYSARNSLLCFPPLCAINTWCSHSRLEGAAGERAARAVQEWLPLAVRRVCLLQSWLYKVARWRLGLSRAGWEVRLFPSESRGRLEDFQSGPGAGPSAGFLSREEKKKHNKKQKPYLIGNSGFLCGCGRPRAPVFQ